MCREGGQRSESRVRMERPEQGVKGHQLFLPWETVMEIVLKASVTWAGVIGWKA